MSLRIEVRPHTVLKWNWKYFSFPTLTKYNSYNSTQNRNKTNVWTKYLTVATKDMVGWDLLSISYYAFQLYVGSLLRPFLVELGLVLECILRPTGTGPGSKLGPVLEANWDRSWRPTGTGPRVLFWANWESQFVVPVGGLSYPYIPPYDTILIWKPGTFF